MLLYRSEDRLYFGANGSGWAAHACLTPSNMIVPEPVVEPPRSSEVLVIAVDCGKYGFENPDKFALIHDVATRMARNRLLYGQTDHDCIGVFKVGSNNTKNRLADDNPPGYRNIELVVPAVRRCLHAVRSVRDLTPTQKRVILLNVIEVLGDYLADVEMGLAKKKRVVLFTHKSVVPKLLSDDDRDQFVEVCDLYRQADIQLDIVCVDWEAEDDDHDDELGLDETGVKHTSRTTSEFFDYAKRKGIFSLWAIANATGGMLYSVSEASSAVETPVPKRIRATARFRGTLDIGDTVKIPVKAYLMASEAKKEAATKLSWAASRAAGYGIGVHVETQRVQSATDDVPLSPSEIVNAYAYGTDLVPEQQDTGEHAWSLSMPCGMSTIAFVPQSAVPERWFMSAVCCVLSMPGVAKARRAMDALVQAMHSTGKGMLARFIPLLRGGPPGMAYLWPVMETDRETGKIKNRYLCLAELPLKEDIRHYPFSSLKWVAEDLPALSESVMDSFIESRILSGSDAIKEEDRLAGEEENGEDAEPFDSAELCNPALDRFYVAVAQRALDGPEGFEIPEVAAWQRRLLTAESFIPAQKRAAGDEALKKLKSTLPVSRVPPKERTKKKVIESALKGEAASIGDFLPPDTEVPEDGNDANAHLENAEQPEYW